MRVAVVTGVAGGIGGAIATNLASARWTVVGTDMDAPAAHLPLAAFHQGDLRDRDLPAALMDLAASHGPVVGLVNNAGMPMDAPLLNVDDSDLEAVVDVNLLAPFRLIRTFARSVSTPSAAVVNVASVHAVATSLGASAYAAAKGGLLALTRAAAIELADRGIRCNAVLPGAIDTPMLQAGLSRQPHPDGPEGNLHDLTSRTPLRRVGRSEEIATAVEFLLGDRSAFTTGQSLIVDGGALARLSTE